MKRKFVKLSSAMALMVLLIAGCDGVSSSSDVSSSHISSETSSSLVSESSQTRELLDIEISNVKTEYFLGEKLSTEGLTVKLIYNDGEETVSLNDIAIDSGEFDNSKEGTYKIYVELTKLNRTVNYEVVVSKRPVDYSKSIKILAVGNSFSDDSMEHLYHLLKDKGAEEIILGNLYIGGCDLRLHALNAVNNLPAYDYRKNTSGTWNNTPNTSILTALKQEEWDVISIQQASGSSGLPETYNEDLTTLISYINTNKLNPEAKIVWNMTWAYQGNSTHNAFPNYNNDQMTMYNAIVNAVQTKILTNENISLVIPTGTAIQNARTSTVGDNLTRDGYHLTYDFGRYVAGLTWLKAITGWDIDDINYTPGVTINEWLKNIAKESVNNAIAKPFEVTPSQFDVEPTPDLSNHKEFDWKPVGSAYWFSTDVNYNLLITHAGNSLNYIGSAFRFTKEEIPVGSYIYIKSGWQYRPEGWISDERQTTRPGNTSVTYVEVTEEWWGDYTLRGFNISKTSGGSIARDFHLARDIFKIYVPIDTPVVEDEVVDDSAYISNIENYDRFTWVPCSGFYNSNLGIDIDIVNGTLSRRFITTQLFTKEELPVGTIVIADEGWQYRPERWLDLEPQAATRLPNTTGVLVLDEDFWGEHQYVAFNISKTVQENINQVPYDAFNAFRIYIPKA